MPPPVRDDRVIPSVVVGVVLLGVIFVLASMGETGGEGGFGRKREVKAVRAQAAAPVPVPRTVPATPVPAAPIAGHVTIRFVTEPIGATVSRDGVEVGTTPLELQVEPSSYNQLEYLISSPGYLDHWVTVDADASNTVRVVLEPR